MTAKTIRIIEELRRISDSEWEEIKRNLEIQSETKTDSAKKQNCEGTLEDYEIRVYQLCKELGIPANIKGHKYIRSAVMHCIKNPEMSIVGKNLYLTIAKEYETTPTRVSRGICHAVEKAWDRANPDIIYEIFGFTYSPIKGRPTNFEFIATVTDYLLNS